VSEVAWIDRRPAHRTSGQDNGGLDGREVRRAEQRELAAARMADDRDAIGLHAGPGAKPGERATDALERNVDQIVRQTGLAIVGETDGLVPIRREECGQRVHRVSAAGAAEKDDRRMTTRR